MEHTNKRQCYIDWLRIAAIFGVLVFHSARPFVPDDPWHINNAETSNLLLEFNFWLSRFRMPLLFFISGAVSLFVIGKKSTGQFLTIRFKRLFVPVLVGILLIVPPQIYFERLMQGFKGNFLDFYPSVLQFEPYPEGNTSWHHLWFICYLFLYNLLLAPFFAWAASRRGEGLIAKLSYFTRGKRVYWLILPSVIWFALTAFKYPQTNDLVHDLSYFFYWLSYVWLGFVFMKVPGLMDSLERNRKTSLAVAFLLMILINALRWNGFNWSAYMDDWQNDFRTYLYVARHPINSWMWVFAIVGYGKRYLNKFHPVLHYLNQAVYPFYILHQTVIVVIAFYVVQTTETIIMKFLFITILSLIISMGIYHLFIKPVSFMRFLFGMNPAVSDQAVKKEEKTVPLNLNEVLVGKQ